MNGQDDKKDQIFTVHKSQQKQLGSSVLDKRSFNEFECRESGLSLDNLADKKLNKKDDKMQRKNDQKQYMNDQNINNMHNNYTGEDQAKLKRKQELDHEYDQQNFKYVNEGFTVQSNYFIKKIAQDDSASKYACKYPLYKMIRSIVKKFLFNELEIIFFAYFIEKNQWNVEDKLLRQYAFYLKDFLNITEVNEPLDYKSVLLYLLLNAYLVKYYLNDSQTMDMFKNHVDNIVPKFRDLYTHWSKNCASSTLKIDTKQLNKVFKKISAKPTDKNSKVEDYNSLVDAIIQISPPYNNDKSQKEKADKNQDDSNNNNNNNNGNGTIQPTIKTEENLSNSHNQLPQINKSKKQHQQQQQQQQQEKQQQIPSNQSQKQFNQEPNLYKQMSSKMFPGGGDFANILGPDNNQFPGELGLKKQDSIQPNFMDQLFNLNKQESTQQQGNNLPNLDLMKQASMQSEDGIESLITKTFNQQQSNNGNNNFNNSSNNNNSALFQSIMQDGKQNWPLLFMQQSSHFPDMNMFNNTNLLLAQSINQNNPNNNLQNNSSSNNNNSSSSKPIILNPKKKTEVLQKNNSSVTNNNNDDNNKNNNNNDPENQDEDDEVDNLPEQPQLKHNLFSTSVYMDNDQ